MTRLPLRVGPVGLALLGLALALALGSCLDPTELRLHVHTNVPCTDPGQWKGVAVYVGAPGPSLEDKAPALTTTSCNQQGQVGSLVVVPSGSRNAEVGLRIVAGLEYQPEDCAAHHYQGCIVARRTVRFDAHNPLDLDIALTRDCVGLGCDATHSCVDGTCAVTEGDTPTADSDVGPQVRCGDNGLFCPTTGNVCCLSVDQNAGTTFGECRPPAGCMLPSIVLGCDDVSDCAGITDDAGRPGICYLSYQRSSEADPVLPSAVWASHCISRSGSIGSLGLELCQTRQPCLNDTAPCRASRGSPQNPLPGYFWCEDRF